MALPEAYLALEKPIRELDTTEFVKRYFEGVQQQANQSHQFIEDLIQLIDIDTIRADLLQYKLGQVGFGKSFKHITDRLDEAQTRKLLAVAILLWQYKTSEKGLLETIRFLARNDPIHNDWFYFRSILGEVMIGEEQKGSDPYLIGGQISTYDEWISNLRVMNDGTLDKRLLLDAAKLQRMLGERLELVVLDYLDAFRFGRDKWTDRKSVV